MTLDIEPDVEQAAAFLARLDFEASSFTFQTLPESRGSHVRPQVFHGSIADCSSRLVTANRGGAGVFFMVNAGDGRGRRAENVTRVRAHFVDLDEPGIDPLFTAVETPPHIIVESSPGKWHAYWKTEDAVLADFPGVQKLLAARFSGDLAVCDLPRVMRLPGFFHLKQSGTPFLTRMHLGPVR